MADTKKAEVELAESIKATTAVLEKEGGSVYGKKPAAEPGPVVYGEAEEEKVVWDEELTRLPRIFHVKSSDIPGCPGTSTERASLVRRARAGDATAKGVLNIALNLLLELMGRYKHPRQMVDSQNRLLFLDTNENLTQRKYSQTLKDSEGHPIRHEKAMQVRSPWGVRPGVECQSAAGTPVPVPGHYKLLVEENFDNLFPKLFFNSDVLDSREQDPTGARPELRASYLENLKAQNDDNAYRRAELLKWLPSFIKRPVCSWNGLD